MKKLLISLALLPLLAAAEPKVLEVGVKPESVCRGFGGKLYVTIIGGEEPGDGGINVIDGDDVSEFCRGMNSPKGIAFVGDHLVTADETTVWKVDASGKATKIAEADDFPTPPEFLNDVAASSDGKSVYVTEMSHPKWMFNPDGERELWPIDSPEAKAPMLGCVYKVGLDGSVSLAVPAGDKLMPGPNGVTTMQSKDGKEILVMGDFFTGGIVAYNERFDLLVDGMRGADAVSVTDEAIFVSSWPLGTVWRYDRKSKELKVLSDDFTTAADFFHDRENKQLIVPDMLEGTVTFLPAE